ncbi:MAG: hypothetical protein EHM23_22740 [Acidobacteria bacterium]|nr:MAG: hypothetical protein EHM23_22740 [Acidobacteriota bacterium]
MRQYEYRIEQILLDEKTSRDTQITDSLNDFAREGWRVVSLDVDASSKASRKVLNVLLERRAKKGEPVKSSAKKPSEPTKREKAGKVKKSPRPGKASTAKKA